MGFKEQLAAARRAAGAGAPAQQGHGFVERTRATSRANRRGYGELAKAVDAAQEFATSPSKRHAARLHKALDRAVTQVPASVTTRGTSLGGALAGGLIGGGVGAVLGAATGPSATHEVPAHAHVKAAQAAAQSLTGTGTAADLKVQQATAAQVLDHLITACDTLK